MAEKVIRGLIFVEIPLEPYAREPVLILTPMFKKPIEDFVEKLMGEVLVVNFRKSVIFGIDA